MLYIRVKRLYVDIENVYIICSTEISIQSINEKS